MIRPSSIHNVSRTKPVISSLGATFDVEYLGDRDDDVGSG